MQTIENKKTPLWRKWLRTEYVIFTLAVGFILGIHQHAAQERFLFTLFFTATAFAACALVRRRAFGLAATTVAVTGGAIFVTAYYAAAPDYWVPWVDPIRDVAALGLLLYLTIQVLFDLYRFQKQEKERQFRQLMEEKTIEMRAAALRSTSHEVRTPLNTITAITETLLDDGSDEELSETQRQFIGDIDDAAQHLLALVNDVLDYAKAEAGMIRLAPEKTQLVDLIRQCVTIVEPKAQQADISVSVHVDTELTEIVADPLRLRQILLNLLSNAIKYNQAGGAVTVRVQPHGKDRVMFSVRDNGRGIAPEHMAHLFDPYYQAAVADQGIGTGLGLAIIKYLAELHGGEVTVESTVGEGSEFFVSLPRVTTAGSCQENAAEFSDEVDSTKEPELAASH